MSTKTVTLDVLEQEVRFLLKTLLRDDLFGEEITLTEAERLLDSSLSLPFSEYSTFLKRNNFIGIERTRNLVLVLERGERIARGDEDDDLPIGLSAFFSARLGGRDVPGGAPKPLSGEGQAAAAEHSPMAPPTTQFIDLDRHDRYVRSSPRGEGTLGHVFWGKDTILDRRVVIKAMDHIFDYVTYIDKDELRSRLQRQWLTQARFKHPHILPVYDMDFAVDVPEVILAPAEGSLRDKLDDADGQGLKDVDAICTWMAQAMWALQHAHEAGALHGGIKPENLLIDINGNVQLSDFGIALVTEKGTETGPPVYVGTGNTPYMPPEQLQGKGAHPCSDIYALGMVFYELLTGSLPGRRSPMPSATNDKIPSAVDDVFDKMTMDKVEDRFASMGEALDALTAASPKLLPGQSALFRQDPVPFVQRDASTTTETEAMPAPSPAEPEPKPDSLNDIPDATEASALVAEESAADVQDGAPL